MDFRNLSILIATFSAIAIAVSGNVFAQEDLGDRREHLEISVEEYHPVHYSASDDERFTRIDQSLSCESNNLLYIQDSNATNTTSRMHREEFISSNSILASIWEQEILDSHTQMCQEIND